MSSIRVQIKITFKHNIKKFMLLRQAPKTRKTLSEVKGKSISFLLALETHNAVEKLNYFSPLFLMLFLLSERLGKFSCYLINGSFSISWKL